MPLVSVSGSRPDDGMHVRPAVRPRKVLLAGDGASTMRLFGIDFIYLLR
jgi:hypothetical protein